MWSFLAARAGRAADLAPRVLPGVALGILLWALLWLVSSSSSPPLGGTVGSVSRELPVPLDDLDAQRAARARLPARYVAVTTLAHGEDIDAALRRLDLADPLLSRALRHDARARALRDIGPGDDIQVCYDERRRLRALVAQVEATAPIRGRDAVRAVAGIPVAGTPVAGTPVAGIPAADTPVAGTRRIVVARAASGRFAVSETFRPHDVYWRSRSGVIDRGFFASMARAEVPGPIVADTLRLFRDRVDFRHGFRPGDAFRLVHEELAGDMGPTRTGRLLAVELQARGEWHRAVWHPAAAGPLDAEGQYLTFDGAPLHDRAAWHMPVRSPAALARLSSPFGVRIHPLSGYSRHHEGIDLAAPRGTPVVAAADGTIAFASWRNGYGRLLVIRHAPPYSTYYAHLDGFAPGIQAGGVVARGDAIGQVGSTGGATGPHLHFELRIAGRPVDPLPELRRSAGVLNGEALQAFRRTASPLLAQIARLRTAPASRES